MTQKREEDFDQFYEKVLSEDVRDTPDESIREKEEQLISSTSEENVTSEDNKKKHVNKYFGDVSDVPFMDYVHEFNDIILGDIKRLSDLKSTNRAMVSILSTRQRLLEDRHILANQYNKLNRQIKEQRGDEYEKIATTLKLRIQQKDDKAAIVAKVLAALESKIKTIADQIDYIEGCIETISSIMHNAKYMIEINKMLGPTI